MFYAGMTFVGSKKEGDAKYLKFMESKWYSYTKLTAYVFFLYELWHHYNDLFYIFAVPHWNWGIVLLLLLSFWLPLSIPVFLALLGMYGNSEEKFGRLFVNPNGI